MIISLFVLFSGYLMRLLKLSESATVFSRLWIRTKPNHKIRSLRKSILNRHWIWAYMPLETLQILTWALLDVYESTLWEIIWLAFALVWGTRNLLTARASSSAGQENTWGFGQLFPIILLVLPLLSIGETFYEEQSPLIQDDVDESLGNNITTTSGVRPHDRNTVQRKLIPVGYWKIRTAGTNPPGAIMSDRSATIRRTGTAIELEEEHLGGVRSRTPLDSDPPVGNHNTRLSNPYPEPSVNEAMSNPDTDYYEYEWFWILILMLISSVVTIVSLVLFGLGQIVILYKRILRTLACMFLFLTCYTAAFVVLSLFHEQLARTLKKYFRFDLRKQQITLRLLAWLCQPLIVGFVVMSLLLRPLMYELAY